MQVSTHDHVGHMDFSPAGCQCLKCGQQWRMVASEPNRAGQIGWKLVPVPYEGDWPAASRSNRA